VKRYRNSPPGTLLIAIAGAVISTGIISCFDSPATAPLGRAIPVPVPIRHTDLQPLPASSIGLGPSPNTRTLITIYPFIEGIVVEGMITGGETVRSRAIPGELSATQMLLSSRGRRVFSPAVAAVLA